MRDFEINIKNIQHSNTIINSSKWLKELIITLKYTYLKDSKQFLRASDFNMEMRAYILEMRNEMALAKNVGIPRYFYQPIPTIKNDRYYYIPIEDKVYDMKCDLSISHKCQYFDWFYTIMTLQTPFEHLESFWEYALINNFDYDLTKMEYTVKFFFQSFQSKYVQVEMNIFHRFQNEINLFYEYNRSYEQIVNLFELWIKYKKSNPKSQKILKKNKTTAPSFPVIKLNFSNDINNKVIDHLYEMLNGKYFHIEKKEFIRHFIETNTNQEYIRWEKLIIELRALIDLLIDYNPDIQNSVINDKNNNLLIEKHFLKKTKSGWENFTARGLNSVQDRKGYQDIRDYKKSDHDIAKIYKETIQLIKENTYA